jgi:peptide/nickel transport system permease protein
MTDFRGSSSEGAAPLMTGVSEPAPVELEPEITPTRRRRRDLGAFAGIVWLSVVAIAALAANVLPLKDPDSTGAFFAVGPMWPEHPLGTDVVGRDVLARLVFGARVSMAVAIGATSLSMVAGVAIGMCAGYLRGVTDGVASFLINYLLAFPPLIFLIALVSALEPGVLTLVLALALLGIPSFARVARANTIAIESREFVVAARALGAPPIRILLREILVNVMLPVTSLALVVMATLVVAEGSLSFLGLGIPPPAPSWGGMLASGREELSEDPLLTLIPAACFFLTVFSFNRLGDWARGRVGRESSI